MHLRCSIAAEISKMNGHHIKEGDFVIVKHTRDRFLSYVKKAERTGGKISICVSVVLWHHIISLNFFLYFTRFFIIYVIFLYIFLIDQTYTTSQCTRQAYHQTSHCQQTPSISQ